MKRWIIALALLLPLTGCANRVELDPRDVEAVEEITRIAKEVRLVVKSAYFGAVKVSVVSQRGGMPIRIDRFGHGEDQIMVSKSKFGDGHISLLLETPDADRFGGVVSDVGVQPGFGEYAYLLTGIWISPATTHIFLNIGPQLRSSTVSWY
jgi:hypothetical protein